MKKEAILDFFIANGGLYSTKEDEIFQHIQSQSIYEVIRVMDRIPLYLEAHLERMRKSAELLGYKILKSDQEIIDEMKKLIEANKGPEMNIKLLCSNFHEKNHLFLQYFVESHYPEEKIYDKGIHTILFHSQRENPNAKVVNLDLRKKISEKMKLEGAFEAILVNQEGYITEGSRSNIFFVKGEQAYTAPPGEVLLGVTRMRIMEICEKVGVNVIEEHIHEKEMLQMEGAFMTGTSVNVLPIHSIGNHVFTDIHHSVTEKIAQGYQADMIEYTNSCKIWSS
ncbi:MAG: branched-chain amino acid aminotransferase [Anaerosolibacter sp.]|jgi:branched-chain amino acid aminotransferase|uniref:aminotransferase class IV n=1 Tax=Anaerosolibacter sp. TaxID=1872527 RepID=UPI00260BAAD6|nr:aminotransferase class IV [Anaerosolibacter sp.]MDF2546403.1 branched-chain amino acid aminotransferase [Anaerosolibacter sp.]